MYDQSKIYQRIGEFVVSFQWLENLIREIGWFVLDPERKNWPPKRLRKEKAEELFAKVEELFIDAISRCGLEPEHETSLRTAFARDTQRLNTIRRARNKTLHSAFVELKAGDEVQGLLRSNPRLITDPETNEVLFDHEILSDASFEAEFKEMAELAWSFGIYYKQLIHRLDQG